MTLWTPLADFIRTRPAAAVPWSHPIGTPRGGPSLVGLEEIVDTLTALQRAEWLEDGVYVGPQSYATVHTDLTQCARTLGVPVPPAIVTPIPARQQRILGTSARPSLHLSSFFLRSAPDPQRRFLLGRLLGPIATQAVTADSVHALLVDDGGLRQLARRSLGPTVEVALAPLSLAARLVLTRSHRRSEITNDRAGLLCTDSMDDAGRALLRIALGVTPDVEPDAYLEQLDEQNSGSPGRWAELLASSPWTHKRIRALKLFAQSAAYRAACGLDDSPEALSDTALNSAIDTLMGVAPWNA